jgi:hypothetical protein
MMGEPGCPVKGGDRRGFTAIAEVVRWLIEEAVRASTKKRRDRCWSI